MWAGVKPTCLTLSSMKSIRKAWAATAGEAEEEDTRLLAGGSRVQSLWVQPVPRECEQGVPVAVEGFRRWRVRGLVSEVPSHEEFRTMASSQTRTEARGWARGWEGGLGPGRCPPGALLPLPSVLQLTRPRVNQKSGFRWREVARGNEQ